MQTHKGRWKAMMRRCYEPSHQAYPRYGGRGIKVCAEWHDYSAYENWCNKVGVTDTVDRIDNDGDYRPENCRPATRSENSNNRGNNRVVVIDGIRYTAAEVSRICGISDVAAGRRIMRWPSDKVLIKGRTKQHIVRKQSEAAHA